VQRFLRPLVAVLLVVAPGLARAQAREVTGKITEAGTGAPVADATVGIPGQQLGVRSNPQGEYRLRVPAGDVAIMARAIGFKRVTIRLTATQSMADFSLDRIREVQPWFNGDYVALLVGGQQLRVSRVYRDNLLRPEF